MRRTEAAKEDGTEAQPQRTMQKRNAYQFRCSISAEA